MINPVGRSAAASAAASAGKTVAAAKGGVGAARSSLQSAQKASGVFGSIKTFVGNIFSAIRTILAYIPILGRAFAKKSTPESVASKPALTTWGRMKKIASSQLSQVKNSRPVQFVGNHKVAALSVTGAVVASGVAYSYGVTPTRVADAASKYLPTWLGGK